MSLSLDQAIQMEKAIRESGVISTVGFQQRYDPRYQAAQIFLQNKKLVMMTMIICRMYPSGRSLLVW